VLCALDLGATAEATLAHAVAMANALEGELLVLYVAASRGIEVARNALAALVAKAPVASRGLQERVVTGVPYVEILAAARESGSDLVVVGSHGGGVGDRPFLGSTTLHLFRHSQCPVFVVPVAISRRREAARQVPPSALDVTERPDVAARLRSCQVRLERRRPSGE
jgi:nucleotide-binding universal stress UspA family protein